jgi:transposase-like protein
MKQKSGPGKAPAEQVLKDIRRQTRRQYSAEEKIRIVLEGLRGEENISELCRREGIAASMYYGWSKEFLEAGKRRLAGDTARAATSGEVKDLRREATALKEVVADLTLENRLLKKRMARPVASGFFECAMIGLLQRIRPRTKPRPRWRYARPGPHKHRGVGRRFFNQVSRTPFDCQAISFPPLANTVSSSAPQVRRSAAD